MRLVHYRYKPEFAATAGIEASAPETGKALRLESGDPGTLPHLLVMLRGSSRNLHPGTPPGTLPWTPGIPLSPGASGLDTGSRGVVPGDPHPSALDEPCLHPPGVPAPSLGILTPRDPPLPQPGEPHTLALELPPCEHGLWRPCFEAPGSPDL